MTDSPVGSPAVEVVDDNTPAYYPDSYWWWLVFGAILCFGAAFLSSIKRLPPFNIKVNPDKLMANACIILAFSIIYATSMLWTPQWWTSPIALPPVNTLDSIQRGIYFAFITHSTVGYGDFSPVHPVTRSMVILHLSIMMVYNFLS